MKPAAQENDLFKELRIDLSTLDTQQIWQQPANKELATSHHEQTEPHDTISINPLQLITEENSDIPVTLSNESEVVLPKS